MAFRKKRREGDIWVLSSDGELFKTNVDKLIALPPPGGYWRFIVPVIFLEKLKQHMQWLVGPEVDVTEEKGAWVSFTEL